MGKAICCVFRGKQLWSLADMLIFLVKIIKGCESESSYVERRLCTGILQSMKKNC